MPPRLLDPPAGSSRLGEPADRALRPLPPAPDSRRRSSVAPVDRAPPASMTRGLSNRSLASATKESSAPARNAPVTLPVTLPPAAGEAAAPPALPPCAPAAATLSSRSASNSSATCSKPSLVSWCSEK
eukprot:scaffold11777_cov99-Isochrysis_galbana.AAC.5